MKKFYSKFPPGIQDPKTEDEEQPLGREPAALPVGSSQVCLAMLCFNTQDDDNVDTCAEQPAQPSTDSRSGAASLKPANSESAATPPTPTGAIHA